MRVCYFGTYRTKYSRNRIMIEGLRCVGVEVIECNEQLWQGIDDRVQTVSGGWMHPHFWWRLLRCYAHLIMHYRKTDHHDIVIVGYPGQMDVFIARILCWIYRKPLVWDVFMSIYLISCERRIDQQSRLSVGLLRGLERWACSMPDMLILDTEDYVLWFNATYAIPEERFRLVPTGADDTTFKPLKNSPPDNSLFRLIYYGTFIPNHGVAHIVEAALLLKDHADIVFELIGTGPDRYNAEALAKIYGLKNILFTDWLDQKVLVSRIAQADACLGAFGTTTQSLMTIQNKIFEGLAMGKPVISGDSPAVRKVFENKKHIYLCQRANSQSIAHAIIDLKSNSELRKKLSEEGNKLFLQTFSIQQIGTLFKKHLCNLISKGNDEK